MTQVREPLVIVYQDADYVVIDKPSGLLVHRSKIASGAREFALQRLRDQLGQHVFPVHRLDRPTSGLLMFALHKEAAQAMTQAFADRHVEKTYHAVVRGYIHEAGALDYALKEELDAYADEAADPDKLAQPAVTHYEPLALVELPFAVSKKHATSRYSLVKVMPKTGRKHQLRRHMAHLRHPIVGDSNHGDNRHNRFFASQFDSHRLLLAATGMRFIQPLTGQQVEISMAIPEVLLRAFRPQESLS